MPLVQKTSNKFTYADYIAWPDDERWELIEDKRGMKAFDVNDCVAGRGLMP